MVGNLALGSVWRRWDLHIHAWNTVKNNQFSGDLETYIGKIEEAPSEISVIGITDYFRIEGYKKLKQEKEKGHMANIDLIIPNIEFRLGLTVGRDNSLINIHLLINPEENDHVEKTERSLSRFVFEANKERYSCNDQGFIALGKARLSGELDDCVYLQEGISKFCPSHETFRDWYDKEGWLKNNSMVIVSNSEGDGISGIPSASDRAVIKDDLLRLSDAVFSGNPTDREYYLGRRVDSPATLEQKIGGLKPCIHGSDAHKLDDLFEPDGQRYCWIKADPTFEGLKQIIFEPEDRIFIGKTPPDERYADKVVRKISLNHSPNWLDLNSIELNPGYVAIIGNKGSGKTALADMISYAAQAWNAQDKSSFIKKADKEISETNIELEWADRHTSKKTINFKDYNPKDVQVRYLSQQFVENLCSEDRLGKSLRDEIEKVVFSYIDETEKLGASNFIDLRKKKTFSAIEMRKEAEEELLKNIHIYIEASEHISTKPEKLQRKVRLQTDIRNIKNEMPKESKSSQDLTRKITEFREKETKIIRDISEKRQRIETIKKEIQNVGKFEIGLSERVKEITDSLKALGVSDLAIGTLPSFNKSAIELELNNEIVELEKEIGEISGIPEQLEDHEIERILDEKDAYKQVSLCRVKLLIQSLEKKETEDTEKRRKINKAIKDIQDLEAKIKLIEDEVEKLDKETVKLKDGALSNILIWYQKIFEAYEQEEKKLEALYAPLKDRLSGGADYEKRLEFYIQREVDLTAWCKRGYSIFDARKIRQTELGNIDEFIEYIEEHILVAWKANDLKKVSEKIQAIFSKIEKNDPLEKLLKSSYGKKDVYQWLFSTDHITMMYGMKYDGVTLEKLSPGTKGIILLMLYLEMDKTDNRPLIVDQPEENLDNESVFTILTAYFRRAKKRRQIIVITHNPNLVLNTDADQIIVARSEERAGLETRAISYMSGSIENTFPKEHAKYPGIRELACNILEGGEEAFFIRDRRYNMKH